MAKLHIVSIGGTGHKVLTSLIHLAACGAFRNKQVNKINVICIDGDYANGNLERTANTFKSYKDLYQALHLLDVDELIEIDSVAPNLFISLYQDDKTSLSMAFAFPKYNTGTPEDELIRFLYTDAERVKEVKGGFYGHTSIGAVMARNILNDETKPEGKIWAKFKGEIAAEDQVVVIGSIFGGTGASCIPVVLKDLEGKKENGAGLAAIILAPYFNIVGEPDKDKKVQPDSNNFNIKAKAALNYYEIEKKLEATHSLYLIGEPSDNFSYETKNDDGAKQKNKAHPIELFAATAVLDFIRNNKEKRKGQVYVAKRPLIGKSYCYTWDMLQNVDENLHILIQAFTKTAIFYNKVLYPQLAKNNSAGVWEDNYDDGQWTLQTKMGDDNKYYYENIHDYLGFFVEWIFEIHKRNLNKVSENGELQWEDDTRVRLFNTAYRDLFYSTECGGGKVKNFDKLVFNEAGQNAEEILAKLDYTKPKNDIKGFPALFATLKSLFTEKKNNKLQRLIPKNDTENQIKTVNFVSEDNDVDLGVPTDVKQSLWVGVPNAKILGEIADGLPNTDLKAYTRNDVAIPSPWSIFITNEMSLTLPKFKGLNEYAYNQWCGLIALLILRQLNNYEQGHELRIVPLKWNHQNDPFFETIKDLSPPKSQIFKNKPDWLDCSAVKLGNETIAFLAHNTFVCPVFSISKSAITELNVLDPTIVGSDYEFRSPKDYFVGRNDSNRSKYALQLVLGKIRDIISDQIKPGRENLTIIQSMQKLLDQYLEDLGKVVENGSISLPPEQELSINSVYDIFKQLCIEPKELDVDKLPFLLKHVFHEKNVALLSLNFTGMTPTELSTSNITQNLVYSQIRPDNIRSFTGIKDGIEIVLDTDLLLDSMVMRDKEGNTENAFHSLSGKTTISGYEVIWPVSEKLLELYTADRLNKMLDIKKENDVVFVTLTLELKGKMRSHEVTKKYHIKRISDENRGIDDVGVCSIFESRRLPLWAIWPYAKILNNQKASVWERYTFFCVDHVYTNTPVFKIEPLFTGGKEEDLKPRKLSAINENAKELYYRHCTELPSALKILEQKDGDPYFRGAVFLNQPEPTEMLDSAWNVGVDFGTTSTSVFYNKGGVNDIPVFLQLLNEYRWKEGSSPEPEPVNEKLKSNNICVLCNSIADQGLLNKYFIDRHCLSQKGYTSTFEELVNTSDNVTKDLFDTGRIFWHNYENLRNVNADENRRKHLKSGIKWESDKKWTARYLNQLLTQISYRAIEMGIGKIRWFFSYPTAFSSDDQISYSDRMEQLITDLRDTGLDHKFDKKNNILTESVAAALSFWRKKIEYDKFLCIDIGGGTSDISIWVNKELKFQTSVKFASRDMFIAPLAKLLKRQSVMNTVCTSIVSDRIHTMLRYGEKEASEDSIPFLIENVLFEYLIDFKLRLNELRDEDKTAKHNFVYLVYVAYAGLFFYLTNLIVALLNECDIRGEIVVGLSGKGSKLTEWIQPKPIYKTAEAIIRKKTGVDITFSPQFNGDDAKTETACGLICYLNENNIQKTSSDDIIPKIFMGCGCTVQIKDGQEQPKQFEKKEFVPSNIPLLKKPEKLNVIFDESSKKDFDEFIDFFDLVAENARNARDEIDSIPREWYNKGSLLSKMTAYFNNQILAIERRFDPPFIVMLKVFLKNYSEYLYEE
jgi:hypothetical protein